MPQNISSSVFHTFFYNYDQKKLTLFFRHSQPQEDDSYDASPDMNEDVASIDRSAAPLKRSATSLSEKGSRKRRAMDGALEDSLSTPPTYDLRQRQREQQNSSAKEQRAARLARRAKHFPSIESLGHASLDTQDSIAVTDESEDDDDDLEEDEDSMDWRKSQTYDKAYVDAHPNVTFYHAGNGWYKKGIKKERNKTGRAADSMLFRRDREQSPALGTDTRKSVHKSELDKFPGHEFHHTGNGWYRPGPDPNGKRASITITADEEDGFTPVGTTVDRAYKEAHPEIEWVHRGNGRYMRKSDLMRDESPEANMPATSNASRRQSEPTYSKSYVLAHPGEEFYHTGNARYKRGSRPNARQSFVADKSEEESEDEPVRLVDKAYVLAHPDQIFHHRGQGRYARGPRPAPEQSREDEHDAAEYDSNANDLVDTAYVDAHPHQNFYHKGQGRWARGLPPLNCHNKTAVRGPGAKEKMAERRNSEVTEPAREVDDGPPLTALLTRLEGPEKYPNLQWTYRGGGKWGRITKQEYEAMTQAVPSSRGKPGPKRRINKISDGPGAQLEREAAAANNAAYGLDGELYGDGDSHVDGSAEKPKMRRKRRNYRLLDANGDGGGSKYTSNSHSNAPTPKPRMLEPEEDILGPEDLPDIYRDEWSPLPSGEGDALDRQLREEFYALNTDKIIASLTKFDPSIRSLANLKAIAANAARALRTIQDEYLALDKITAPHAKVPRKPAKGGRVPVDPQIFEDKKEAELYDYLFDPRKVGYQDPEAQRIVRDAEGRELRKRRNRIAADPPDPIPGWHFGESQTELAPKRTSRQPQRFENMPEPPRKRMRTANNSGKATPDRAATPLSAAAVALGRLPSAGRLSGTLPKRIRELRDESVAGSPAPSDTGSGGVTKVRKGRPPGSKNLHKRRDAGIKKGPRKPKVPPGSGVNGVARPESVASSSNAGGETIAGEKGMGNVSETGVVVE